ncbi:MAG: hypothetical protein UT36_C0003G0063 [Candidatus Peregrinibacteria bacterium GW2011_GWF2_39_17]|nr:MAG: hypothetical protein UT36_C0003G0063 [Candidatus Peregrinibacteria bacterium GW2011_GWF2_39_17]HCW31975.1 hypothetical protein [Candidatus Peregrinibacteria bacterium]
MTQFTPLHNFPATNTSLVSGVSPFEDQKFAALEYFLKQLQQVKPQRKEKISDDRLEDLEINFLGKCDKLILDFFSKKKLRKWILLKDNPLRQHLAPQVGLIGEEEENKSIHSLIDDCLDLIEQLEDSSECWLSVILLEKKQLKAIYEELKILKRKSYSSDSCAQKLKILLVDLMNDLPFFMEEEALRFQLMADDLGAAAMVCLLKHLFQAQMEYGQYLQEQYLDEHPQLISQIKASFWREAGKMAAQVAAR